MHKTRFLLLLVILCASVGLRAQEFTYPFQNPALSDDERLDNAVSLMTVDEKIATVVGQGVPRLGIAGPGATEAIHGIVRGGDSELPALNPGPAFRWPGWTPPKYRNSTAFPQAYGIGETWDREMAHIVGEVMSCEARFYSQGAPFKTLVLWPRKSSPGSWQNAEEPESSIFIREDVR